MTNHALPTKSAAKRATAAAIAETKARRGWSNADAGDVLGISEGTVRNRLDAETIQHQMQVDELARSIVLDGPDIANRILGPLAGVRVVAIDCGDGAPCALAAAGASARGAADLIEAAPDGISREEAIRLLPGVVHLQTMFAGLEVRLRSTIEGRVRSATG